MGDGFTRMIRTPSDRIDSESQTIPRPAIGVLGGGEAHIV